jgi:MoxR-like ATPase
MYGMDSVVHALLCALLTGGHVLLEGNPGLGKTALAKAMARAMGIGGERVVGRIQFTPDLMPSDITGTGVPKFGANSQMEIVFEKGPIFHQILIADEINRATPKTQAAMLEAMGEGQVTVVGKGKPEQLREIRDFGNGRRAMTPFMVMATQNPIDQEGTYDLPEAQSDRFMMKIRMQNPGSEVLEQIVRKEIAPQSMTAGRHSQASPSPQDGLIALHDASVAVLSQVLPAVVLAHVVNVVQATTGRFDELRGMSEGRKLDLRHWIEGRVVYSLGPRAATALARGALAWAAVTLEDPDKAEVAASGAAMGLAAILVPTLRHRVRIQHPVGVRATTEGELADALDVFLREMAARTAPDLPVQDAQAGYHDRFAAFQTTVRERGILL